MSSDDRPGGTPVDRVCLVPSPLSSAPHPRPPSPRAADVLLLPATSAAAIASRLWQCPGPTLADEFSSSLLQFSFRARLRLIMSVRKLGDTALPETRIAHDSALRG